MADKLKRLAARRGVPVDKIASEYLLVGEDVIQTMVGQMQQNQPADGQRTG